MDRIYTYFKRLRKYKSIPVGIIIAAGIRPAELAADGEEEEDDQPLSNNCADDLLFSSSSDSLLVHNIVMDLGTREPDFWVFSVILDAMG